MYLPGTAHATFPESPCSMSDPERDRAERLAKLQALAEDQSREMPQLDEGALTTLLADLGERERKTSVWRKVGWAAIAVVALVLVVLLVRGLR